MKKLSLFLAFTLSVPALGAVGDSVDCSSAYQELSSRIACKVIACEVKFQEFIGTWEGPFEAFDRGANIYRPLRNQVRYMPDDCLENVDSSHAGFGDKFIIGRKTDIYPPFKELKGKTDIGGLLVTGRHLNGSRFLRTVSPLDERTTPEESFVEYNEDKENKDPNVSVWWKLFKKAYQGACPEPHSNEKCDYDMKFIVTDGKQSANNEDTRHVSVKMEMFLASTKQKVMEQVTNRGYHTKQK